MKTPAKKIFIKENDKYVEIEYDKFCKMKGTNKTFAKKRFILIQGCLLEVDEDNYVSFNKERNRNGYLRRLDVTHNLVSIEEMINEEENISDYELCTSEDAVYAEVEKRILLERLHCALSLLENEERELIQAIYYNGTSLCSFAKSKGLAPTTVAYRARKTREKLRALLNS